MAPSVSAATNALLARAHSPDTVSRLYKDKILHRPFLLRPSSPGPSDERSARRQAREKRRKASQHNKAPKPKPLSARRRRALGLYDVPREQQKKYAVFEPLHRLWLGYVREILGAELYTGGQGAAAKLASADMHGAEVEVVRSGCVGRVGIRGIVVKDAKFVFEIVTRKKGLKIVPKEGTVFRVEVPVETTEGEKKTATGKEEEEKGETTQATTCDDLGTPKMVFELHGQQFMHRAADRANKKIKGHFMKNL